MGGWPESEDSTLPNACVSQGFRMTSAFRMSPPQNTHRQIHPKLLLSNLQFADLQDQSSSYVIEIIRMKTISAR